MARPASQRTRPLAAPGGRPLFAENCKYPLISLRTPLLDVACELLQALRVERNLWRIDRAIAHGQPLLFERALETNVFEFRVRPSFYGYFEGARYDQGQACGNY